MNTCTTVLQLLCNSRATVDHLNGLLKLTDRHVLFILTQLYNISAWRNHNVHILYTRAKILRLATSTTTISVCVYSASETK